LCSAASIRRRVSLRLAPLLIAFGHVGVVLVLGHLTELVTLVAGEVVVRDRLPARVLVGAGVLGGPEQLADT
jgi:hypothetical protein